MTSCTIINKSFKGGQDACSTKKFILGGTGKMPVPLIKATHLQTF